MASYPKYLTDGQRRHLATNGVNGLDAEYFTEAGVTDTSQMIYLKANGVDGVYAERFTDAGITGLTQMIHLTANGVDGLDALWFSQARVTDLDQMIYLANNGVGGWFAKSFSQAGVTDPDQMISLVKLIPHLAVLDQIPAARKRAGDETVDRVLSAGERIGRFPNGTLTGLTRSTKIAAELKALADEALDVTITLVEDQFDTTGKVTVGLIRETLNIIH